MLTLGGPRLCSFVSLNPDGPHVQTAVDWRKSKAVTYVVGGHRENIFNITKLHKEAKESINLKSDIPYIMAEDETSMIYNI